jgi:hypothetical protein
VKNLADKLAFLYWYETMMKKGIKLTPKQTQLYEDIKHEVMDYGYNYFENHGN